LEGIATAGLLASRQPPMFARPPTRATHTSAIPFLERFDLVEFPQVAIMVNLSWLSEDLSNWVLDTMIERVYHIGIDMVSYLCGASTPWMAKSRTSYFR
jgi:hypothetical protein